VKASRGGDNRAPVGRLCEGLRRRKHP